MAAGWFSAHLIGNLFIIIVFGLGAIACFAVAIVMLFRPGEKNRDHPKYRIMNDDR